MLASFAIVTCLPLSFFAATLSRHMAGFHGLKGTVYGNGIRVPCFLRWPAGIKSPAKVTRLAAHVDVLPTVLEACGVAVRADMNLDGASLWPLLRDPSAKRQDRGEKKPQ
jgi:arylsulfatase A-like enzyme